ncbi:hypothetical protein FA15DRAFT_22483 [Coprinopsis marcescibilis]|uniref:Chitobiosyldiphosphodolichol beta-mannosyltransferase n=1 Tax=Coprinopsis marcescibilis TaxID=230819 RepID=A0A5C3LFJ9_COPMA|nr:hypothetical protein FA15DRAFT_22483 [Coprinopsis marcescibilis]
MTEPNQLLMVLTSKQMLDVLAVCDVICSKQHEKVVTEPSKTMRSQRTWWWYEDEQYLRGVGSKTMNHFGSAESITHSVAANQAPSLFVHVRRQCTHRRRLGRTHFTFIPRLILMTGEDVLSALPSLVAVLACLALTCFLWYFFKPRNYHSLRSVAILVLGDIGRSPRMMYHAQSFAENGFMTELVGYGGSDVIPALERLPRVRIWHLSEPPRILSKLPFVIAAPFKVIHQVVTILLTLLVWIEKPPEFLLVQNPPSIPTLALVQLVGRIRGSKVIVDWHNLGYSILALKLGKDHLFVRISKWLEQTFGRIAYAHLFVTRAMRDYLVKEWDLQGHKVVLHDRPPRHFHRASTQETHELFQKLDVTLKSQTCLKGFLPECDPPYSTPFTQIQDNLQKPGNAKGPLRASSPRNAPDDIPKYNEIRSPTLRQDRPAILVSSTSWTPDEDFSILLEALSLYENRATELYEESRKSSPSQSGKILPQKPLLLPRLLAIVTGKGPLKEKYMNQVAKLQKSWKWVRCISLWLEAEDYPILLDLGVSLHSSSSALDLPMKVVDMFGCGLPVCALGFACLPELVKHGKNGLIFNDAPELAHQIERLFSSFPQATELSALASSLASASVRPSTPANVHVSKRYNPLREVDWTLSTWEDSWAPAMRPLILSDVNL